MFRTTSTYIVGAAPILTDGVQRMLSGTQFRVLGVCDPLGDFRGITKGRPSLFILIVNREIDEVEGDIRRIRDGVHDARIVLLTPSLLAADVMLALRLGADGYLVHTTSADALLKSLEVVMAGCLVLPREILGGLGTLASAPLVLPQNGDETVTEKPLEIAPPTPPSRDSDMPALSDRESLILRCLVQGDSNKHIARELAVAEATVKVHIKAILRKTRLRNRTQAAIWAINNGETVAAPSLPTTRSAPTPLLPTLLSARAMLTPLNPETKNLSARSQAMLEHLHDEQRPVEARLALSANASSAPQEEAERWQASRTSEGLRPELS